MNNNRYMKELNGLKNLLDRFAITRSLRDELVPCGNNSDYCIADYKVLMCTQNTAVMDKNYKPFLIQGTPMLTEDEKLFIEQYRIGLISNPLSLGYYCDVFCNAQEKRTSKYARKVVESYLQVVAKPDSYLNNDCTWIWKSLMYNSKSYKLYEDDVVNAIDSFLSLDIPVVLKYKLLVNAYNFEYLNAAKVFSFASKYSLMDKISNSNFDNEPFFKMLLKCTPKNEKETIKMINLRLAENEDIIIKQHPIDRASASNYLIKSEYLKNAGLEKEAKECYKLFIQAKSSKEGYDTFNQSLKIPMSYIQPFMDLIGNSSNPIKLLADNDDILPPIEDGISCMPKDFGRLGISVKVTDINGNPHPNNGQAMKLNYNIFYNIITILPLRLSLKGLISKKAFNEEKLVEYLNSTWLGEPRIMVNPTLARTEETWVDSIRPSLHLLNKAVVDELEGVHSSNNEYMCPIDSLTLKIEGCLRDACRKIGISTVREDNHDELTLEEILRRMSEYQKKGGEDILSSKTMNMLKKLLTKDEFKGSNFRNEVAHGFTNASHYTMEKALTVIHCILRISSIRFPSNNIR